MRISPGKFTILVLTFSLSAWFVSAADLTSGLVGHWPLDGNADDVVGKAKGELVGGAQRERRGSESGVPRSLFGALRAPWEGIRPRLRLTPRASLR